MYIPKYRHFKPRNLAVVTIDGKTIYLGKYRSKESRELYDRLIKEWLANGRTSEPEETSDSRDEITVCEVIDAYLAHCIGYYGPLSDRKSETYNMRPAMRTLNELYGDTPVEDFGPLRLKTVRNSFVESGRCRTTVNREVRRIRKMFKWAAAEELIRFEHYQRLTAVDGLAKGRTTAPEERDILPVPEEVFAATLPHLSSIVRDMVDFQLLTGGRPAEVCIIRPVDIDRSGDVWIYRLHKHKTQYRGKERLIAIGPRAQEVLRKYLLRPEDTYCFQPDKRFSKNVGNCYTTCSYRRVIHRACKRAGVELWSPNRLRHNKATLIRKEFGLEAAQVALGHASAVVTQVYAERDLQKAVEVARQTG